MVTTPCRVGNRVESLDKATGRRMHLAYDAGNQLVQVRVQEESKHFTQRYRHDAFGRRLAKYIDPGNQGASEEGGTDYFGWDGDRLVHTERFNSGNAKDDDGTAQPEIVHTVYEPGSFTPLIQLRRAAKAAPDLADELIAHMQPGIAQDALRGMFADIGATANKVNAGLGNLDMAVDAQDFIRERLKGFEQTVNSQREESAKSVEVRHYLCDHLGTPNALVNKVGETEWAGILDIWGNIKVEYNPGKLYQPIRLSGQHQDAKSGLNYNRNRYYDREQGCYINQDPIGILSSDLNLTAYVKNPNKLIDPLGLASCNPQQEERCAQLKKQIFAKVSGLLHEFSKYDPVKDGQGGFPMKHGSGTTKPGGHYTEMTNYQGGLKNDITEYKKDCIGKDRCGGGGKWENIPRSVDELANRPIPEPVYPDNSSNLPKAAVGAAAGVTAGYVLYRVVRMIPSLFFPPSIPANAAIP